MKKSFAIQQMGGVEQLADLLGVFRQAIYQWGEDVPKLRVYQLRELRPDLFPAEKPPPITPVKQKRASAAPF